MTVSGTHDNSPWNFIEVAMSKSKKSGMSKMGVFYFYTRCEEHPDMDAKFQTFLDPSLIGDKVVLDNNNDNSTDNHEDSILSSSTNNTTSSSGSRSRKKTKRQKQGNLLWRGRDSDSDNDSACGPMTICKDTSMRIEYVTFMSKTQDTIVSASQEMKSFMKKGKEFMHRMEMEANKRDARATFHARLELAKALEK